MRKTKQHTDWNEKNMKERSIMHHFIIHETVLLLCCRRRKRPRAIEIVWTTFMLISQPQTSVRAAFLSGSSLSQCIFHVFLSHIEEECSRCHFYCKSSLFLSTHLTKTLHIMCEKLHSECMQANAWRNHFHHHRFIFCEFGAVLLQQMHFTLFTLSHKSDSFEAKRKALAGRTYWKLLFFASAFPFSQMWLQRATAKPSSQM